MKWVKVENPAEGVQIVTLNRPDKRNALSIALMKELGEMFLEMAKNSSQRVVILRGEGPVFSAGLDLKEAEDPGLAEQSTQALVSVLTSVYNLPCVVIAAVHGAAFAGGAGLMAACDFVIAEQNLAVALPETRRGLIAALVIALLRRQLREKDLKELLLFGEPIGAKRAKEMGLVNKIVSKEALMKEALAYAARVLQTAPLATAETKRLVEKFSSRDFTEDLLFAMECHHQMRTSEEAKEGIRAFLEKRDPKWVKGLEG